MARYVKLGDEGVVVKTVLEILLMALVDVVLVVTIRHQGDPAPRTCTIAHCTPQAVTHSSA